MDAGSPAQFYSIRRRQRRKSELRRLSIRCHDVAEQFRADAGVLGDR
jgi:hypothetical protein